GYPNNSPVHFPYLMPTLFNALDGVVPDDWRVYYHDFAQSLTLTRLWMHLDHFHLFDDFLDDAANGNLPSYSFIEPRYFADLNWPNDMHPP
ncbi:alkaline phosphatase family protein, partial [Acinetobacter baumannii]